MMGLIRGELMDLVDGNIIESIFALYRSVPKVREVPKVIEKVTAERTTVPHHVILQQKSASVHPISKVEVVKDTYGVKLVDEIGVNLIQEKPVRTVDTIEKPLLYTQTKNRPVNSLI